MDTDLPVMARTLSTPRLELRAFDMNDLDALHEILSDPQTHTVGDGPFTSINETRRWLEGRAERRRQYGVTWYGVWLPSGPLIGTSGLFIGRTGEEPEFGFEILSTHQGCGYGTEAARAVVEEAHRAGFPTLWATVRPTNAASLTAIGRIGFTEHHREPDNKGDLVFLTHHAAH